MVEPKIAIFCPVSGGEDFVVQQLKNYSNFHSREDFHFLHVSKGVDFDEDYVRRMFGDNIFFSRTRMPTSRRCTFASHIANTLELVSSGERFSHIYMHTDADLLIKGDLRNEVGCYDIAFTRRGVNKKWLHYDKMINDSAFKNIRMELKIPDEKILGGRQEGAFFPLAIWDKVFDKVFKYYGDGFFDNPDELWPMEEVVIPTLANHFIEVCNISCRRSNIVFTKPASKRVRGVNPRDLRENAITVSDVKNILRDDSVATVGAKWFYKDLKDPARVFLNSLYS